MAEAELELGSSDFKYYALYIAAKETNALVNLKTLFIYKYLHVYIYKYVCSQIHAHMHLCTHTYAHTQ